MFRLAIIHYHLNRGGVTRVIANQLIALNATCDADRPCPVMILYGGRALGWPTDLEQKCPALQIELVDLPQLDYDTDEIVAPENLSARLEERLTERGFAADETLFHVHNHNLGKNLALPGALIRLAKRGYHLLLEIHDFAEDLRPQNYRRLLEPRGDPPTPVLRELYPQAPHIQYAVLNDRDYEILRKAGVDRTRLHLLPNPVLPIGSLPDRNSVRDKLVERFGIRHDQRLAIYPVRGIRRKNIGEVLLWSLLPDADTTFGLTLAPLNPDEKPSYDKWRQLAARLELPCVFGLGESGGLEFTESLAAADLLITTSLAEGFGMVFLEAWLAERWLIGRDLPEITRDFQRHGLQLTGLSARLMIPVEWIGIEKLRQTIESAFRGVLDAYARPVPESRWLEQQIEGKIHSGLIDFGDLDVELQARVIEQVARDPQQQKKLAEANPWMLSAIEANGETTTETIKANANVVEREYSVAASGRRLRQIYDQVFASPASDNCDPLEQPEEILNYFLRIDRFRPLRTSP